MYVSTDIQLLFCVIFLKQLHIRRYSDNDTRNTAASCYSLEYFFRKYLCESNLYEDQTVRCRSCSDMHVRHVEVTVLSIEYSKSTAFYM